LQKFEAKLDDEMKKKMVEVENDNAAIARREEGLKNFHQTMEKFGFQ